VEGPADSWLSLRQAAALVGVHPSTLRRWSNEGLLTSYRTPGGHRRFQRKALQVLIARRARLRALGGLEEMWAQDVHALIREHRPFDVAGRALEAAEATALRDYGRKLLAQIGRAAQGRYSESELERSGAGLGRGYAAWARQHDVPIEQMLAALTRVRRTMVEAALDLTESVSLEPRAVGRLLRQVHRQLDAIEMSLIAPATDSPAN